MSITDENTHKNLQSESNDEVFDKVFCCPNLNLEKKKKRKFPAAASTEDMLKILEHAELKKKKQEEELQARKKEREREKNY